ncbi:SDR family NAD(P)-dependent oxidoreductase [Pleionea mediterranea]|uniref:NAD(P)-dependent dehydrogenase (Short-subunit alcohol dehydrogenase family) n=1 Tax=Pleionea mediterranea TaxID=523701 RepID=A0A316GBG7_9GAMM|nr:SDR family oxidoreductase [Pleionea mediterranea]PWK51847.1 NAD(P)-dependent dehydrogenase (short-subunit alcohol dehydrogenase family) [Pleionea mediterranea]
MNTLKGKVALITGGSRGMGAAIAKRFAIEGADVAFTYLNSRVASQEVEAEIRNTGSSVLAIKADNASVESIQKAVDKVVTEFGRIDILVNNAGLFEVSTFEEIKLEQFQKNLNVNVQAVFMASQFASKHMKEGGRIISIGSNLAEYTKMQGLTLYSLTKSALIGFTKGLARDLGPRGITVNIVHPGSTNTDMNPADGEFSDAQRSVMCIPKYSEPKDIAALVTWIAGDESRSITGTGFTIDGGANA